MERRVGQNVGPRSRPSVYAIYEDFRPITEWKYENEAQKPHFLLVLLPGFAKEQIKVSTEGINTLRIRGERLILGNKWSRFEEDFRIPDDCNVRGIRAKFESSTLTITLPKKGHTTTTQVSPKKEKTSRAHLEAPLKVPDDEKRPEMTEQEIKERIKRQIIEEESKKDEYVKEDSEKKVEKYDEGNGKGLFKPETYFETSEKKDEEKSKEVKEKEIEKSKKAMDRLNIGNEIERGDERAGKGKESLNYFENSERKAKEKSGEVEEKEIEKSKKVIDGLNIGKDTVKKRSFGPEIYSEKTEKKVVQTRDKVDKKEEYKDAVEAFTIGSKTNEDGKTKGSSNPEKYIEKIEKIANKEVVNGMSKGDLEEDRQLMVNMGVAVLVIVALGAYITYGLGS